MKIGIVVQRYGEEVIGGAEQLARQLAERLVTHHEVEVLTTCAKDHRDWANHYPEGQYQLNSVTIRRFRVVRRRHWKRFGRLSGLLFRSHPTLSRIVSLEPLERYWIMQQGPVCPDLIHHIDRLSGQYDVLLFFTYLYYPTVFGLPRASGKSILVPTAHDEPSLQLQLFQRLFRLPRHLIFLSPEERDLVHRVFGNGHIAFTVAGGGVELPEMANLGRQEDFFLLGGRIEKGKGCDELFEFCRRLQVQLKVIGNAQISIPSHVDYLGPVDEERKKQLLSCCKAVVIPSRNESLSLMALEGWSWGKPLIVSAHSPVLAGHVRRSGAGYCYTSFEDFKAIVTQIEPEIGLKGRRYVEDNYSWEVVLPRWEKALLDVMRT